MPEDLCIFKQNTLHLHLQMNHFNSCTTFSGMKKAEHQPMQYKIRADDLIAFTYDILIGKSMPGQVNEQLLKFIGTLRSIDGTDLKEGDLEAPTIFSIATNVLSPMAAKITFNKSYAPLLETSP